MITKSWQTRTTHVDKRARRGRQAKQDGRRRRTRASQGQVSSKPVAEWRAKRNGYSTQYTVPTSREIEVYALDAPLAPEEGELHSWNLKRADAKKAPGASAVEMDKSSVGFCYSGSRTLVGSEGRYFGGRAWRHKEKDRDFLKSPGQAEVQPVGQILCDDVLSIPKRLPSFRGVASGGACR